MTEVALFSAVPLPYSRHFSQCSRKKGGREGVEGGRVAHMPPCAQATELSLALRSPLLQPSFLSSPCLSYRVQGPGGSLICTFDSSLAAAELRGAVGAYPRLPGVLEMLLYPHLSAWSSGTFLPLHFQLQTPAKVSPWGVWFAGGWLSRLLW